MGGNGTIGGKTQTNVNIETQPETETKQTPNAKQEVTTPTGGVDAQDKTEFKTSASPDNALASVVGHSNKNTHTNPFKQPDLEAELLEGVEFGDVSDGEIGFSIGSVVNTSESGTAINIDTPLESAEQTPENNPYEGSGWEKTALKPGGDESADTVSMLEASVHSQEGDTGNFVYNLEKGGTINAIVNTIAQRTGESQATVFNSLASLNEGFPNSASDNFYTNLPIGFEVVLGSYNPLDSTSPLDTTVLASVIPDEAERIDFGNTTIIGHVDRNKGGNDTPSEPTTPPVEIAEAPAIEEPKVETEAKPKVATTNKEETPEQIATATPSQETVSPERIGDIDIPDFENMGEAEQISFLLETQYNREGFNMAFASTSSSGDIFYSPHMNPVSNLSNKPQPFEHENYQFHKKLYLAWVAREGIDLDIPVRELKDAPGFEERTPSAETKAPALANLEPLPDDYVITSEVREAYIQIRKDNPELKGSQALRLAAQQVESQDGVASLDDK